MIGKIVDKDLNKRHGPISVKSIDREEGFEIFAFVNSSQEEISLGDEFDYLKFFSQIAEEVHTETKDPFSSFLLATSVGGGRVF